jgi:hypothetical protein
MLYQTPLTVGRSGTATAPITIRVADEPGRDGTVVVFGGRQTLLPYCGQQDYNPVGTANAAGIVIRGQSHVVVDGSHRSGIMVYGSADGVALNSDSTAFVSLRNLELFDNGTFSRGSYGWRTDSEGVRLAGHDILIDRSLIHDNGQDEIQDGDTGSGSGHAGLYNITVRNSWLYNRRDHPLWPGYPFSSGAQDVPAQDCTHVDGLQIWGGGLHQKNFVIEDSVFGPLLAQGLYLGDTSGTSVDQVEVRNTLFINALSHSIIGDEIDRTTPHGWTMRNVTSYLTPRPASGMSSHGGMDLPGAEHALFDSIFYDGYFYRGLSFSSVAGNIYFGGDPVPAGTQVDPSFTGPLPTTNVPTFDSLISVDFTPRCPVCAGKGASLHRPKDLLARIDNLNSSSS